MQVRLPVVVVGGGLTAIDTATESLAYYPLQVEKFLARYESARRERGEAACAGRLERGGARDRRGIPRPCARDPRRARRARSAKTASRACWSCCSRWGGVDHRLSQAPDRQPVLHAESRGSGEGARGRHPLRRGPDARCASRSTTTATRARWSPSRDAPKRRRASEVELPARTILIAAGTQPNTVLAREDAEHFQLDGRYFRAVDENGNPVTPERSAKPAEVRVLMSGATRRPLHELLRRPASVVLRQRGEGDGQRQAGLSGGEPRAGARARRRRRERCRDSSPRSTTSLRATRASRRAPDARPSSKWWCDAPLAARRFRPGQFYRLQNFETLAPSVEGTRLAMEGLALTGAWVDRDEGPGLDHRARDGRLVRPVRAARSPASR